MTSNDTTKGEAMQATMEATIGSMIRFDYENTRDSYIGRIMVIRDTVTDRLVTNWYRQWDGIKRSRYLITVATPNGYRQFYTGSIRNARPVGFFARFGFWIRGINFPKFAVR